MTVVLTGEGGDELFAGYPKYAAEPLARAARRAAAVRARRRCSTSGVDRLPFGFRKLQVVARSARFRDEAERLAAWFAGFAGERARAAAVARRCAPHEAGAARAFAAALEPSRRRGARSIACSTSTSACGCPTIC